MNVPAINVDRNGRAVDSVIDTLERLQVRKAEPAQSVEMFNDRGQRNG